MFKDRVTIEVLLPVGVDVRDVMNDMFERYRNGPTPPGVKFRIVTIESPDTEVDAPCPGCGRKPSDEVGAGCPQCADLVDDEEYRGTGPDRYPTPGGAM